ncbi:hypothetical protein EON82_10915 [bacterium]|nr:MAG: hypothetical protein EON82_10915 [bacterium]
MRLLAAVLLTALAQDKTVTHGKSNAQILAMGRSAWSDYFCQAEGGGSTVALSGAEALYADALGWRNDKIGKAKVMPLRRLLDDVRNHAIEVGTAVTGGGTIWNIIASSLDADAEETIYTVLTLRGNTKKRVVSDMDKAYRRLEVDLRKNDYVPELTKIGRASLPLLRRDLDRVLIEARRRPRKASDALLGFCIKAMTAG